MIAERLAAQGLSGSPMRDPEAVAGRLLAIQAQELRGARLAIRGRTTGLTAAGVDRAISEDRSIVVSTLNRGTLHLVRREDLPWLHAITAPTLTTTSARRLAQEGVPPDAAERGIQTIVRALTDEGPLTRARIAERLRAAGVRAEGQATPHVLWAATLRRLVLRGPLVGAEQAFVLWRDWLGEPPAVDREAALPELARRYLAGHGPASDRDLARWAGINLRDARAGLSAIARELVEREDGLVDLAGRAPAPPLPPPRLLGQFEPLLLGWVSREPIVGPAEGNLVTVNGIFRPFALAGGRAVAGWGLPRGRVALDPFEPLDPAVTAELERDGAAVEAFLGAA